MWFHVLSFRISDFRNLNHTFILIGFGERNQKINKGSNSIILIRNFAFEERKSEKVQSFSSGNRLCKFFFCVSGNRFGFLVSGNLFFFFVFQEFVSFNHSHSTRTQDSRARLAFWILINYKFIFSLVVWNCLV